MTVTIGIKALNEEAHIADALASAVAAAAPFGGEVVLADSGSRDRTVAIARGFPVHIVQLANPEERCCGAGAQLAFQQARGNYFYLLDGDMTLDPDFLRAGIAFLEANPRVGGVGGHVVERNAAGEDFQVRAQKFRAFAGPVDRLDCGGLYRMAALREVGYFADRNLHAFEEFDLGARLAAAGWTLARIDHPAVAHYGHVTGGYRLLWRRLATGYAGGPGEVLKAALGRRHLPVVLRRLRHVHMTAALMLWWAALAATAIGGHWWLLLGLILLPILFFTWRRRSLRLGLYILAAWNVAALGSIGALFRRRVPPDRPLAAVTLAQPGKAADRGEVHAGG
ncbi:glycosyltransferase [Sphingobium aquiterrae]|uniref:glycosyltransferase n=1 Tax=Sphingobium aquiterrae TaxID=2038656 RepID=UPI00301B1664